MPWHVLQLSVTESTFCYSTRKTSSSITSDDDDDSDDAQEVSGAEKPVPHPVLTKF